MQSRPLHEVLCSVLVVSDLFTEHSQWHWLLDTSLELGKSHPAEDDILRQYVVLSQCKACSVLQPVSLFFAHSAHICVLRQPSDPSDGLL